MKTLKIVLAGFVLFVNFFLLAYLVGYIYSYFGVLNCKNCTLFIYAARTGLGAFTIGAILFFGSIIYDLGKWSLKIINNKEQK